MKTFTHLTAYRFIELTLSQLKTMQLTIQRVMENHQLKGTVLLGGEGINLSIAGQEPGVMAFQSLLAQDFPFLGLAYQKTSSEIQPFDKIIVRIKEEIVTFRCPEVDPTKETAPYLEPSELQAWYDQGRRMTLLDTRNHYEVMMGTFMGALDCNIDSFSDFPKALSQLPRHLQDEPVVTFCTGGIRCEKASGLMQQRGFKQVYQLKGGIIHYLNSMRTSTSSYFQGQCFVFDHRIAL